MEGLDREVPEALRRAVGGYAWERQAIGNSTAEVFRLESEGRPGLFVKVAPTGVWPGLDNEARRLQWLAGRRIRCPRVVGFVVEGGCDWLVMTAVPGRPAALLRDDAARTIETVADALRSLHAEEVASCPFDRRLARRIALARRRLAAGLIDEGEFHDEHRGRTVEELFAELLATRPAEEDLVVAHGDPCLPNILVAEGRFSGFIDCGGLGLADRYHDLALAARSVRYNLGPEWEGRFLAAYGLVQPDEARLAFYRMLEELF